MSFNVFTKALGFALVCLAGISVSQPGALAADSRAATDPGLYDRLEAFHGHVCAGSLFGARLGLAAREALVAAGGKGKFAARYFDLSCPVDGIQVAAGTTYGNRALTVQDKDEHRLLLTAEENKLTVEAKLTTRAEAMGLTARELGKKAKTLSAGSPERLKLEQEIEEIYSWLQTAPVKEIAVVTIVKENQ